jgi:hypothetical protein
MKLSPKQQKNTIIALGIVTVLLFLNLIETTKELNTLKDGLFYYDVTISAIDENTGDPVDYITTHGPSISSSDIIQQTTSFGASANNSSISGIAYEARLFGFSADGYLKSDVIIDSNTESQITVKLRKDPSKH